MKKTTKKQAPKRIRKPDPRRRPKPAAEPAEAAPKVEQAEAHCAPPQDRPKTLAELYPVQFSEDWIIEATAAGKMFNDAIEAIRSIAAERGITI